MGLKHDTNINKKKQDAGRSVCSHYILCAINDKIKWTRCQNKNLNRKIIFRCTELNAVLCISSKRESIMKFHTCIPTEVNLGIYFTSFCSVLRFVLGELCHHFISNCSHSLVTYPHSHTQITNIFITLTYFKLLCLLL
jgi:hypothetical protein